MYLQHNREEALKLFGVSETKTTIVELTDAAQLRQIDAEPAPTNKM